MLFSDLENNSFRGTANSCRWVLRPEMDPEFSPKNVQHGVKKPTHLWRFCSDVWAPFSVHFGSNFGAEDGHDVPRWTQEGPQEPQSTEKQHLQTV